MFFLPNIFKRSFLWLNFGKQRNIQWKKKGKKEKCTGTFLLFMDPLYILCAEPLQKKMKWKCIVCGILWRLQMSYWRLTEIQINLVPHLMFPCCVVLLLASSFTRGTSWAASLNCLKLCFCISKVRLMIVSASWGGYNDQINQCIISKSKAVKRFSGSK